MTPQVMVRRPVMVKLYDADMKEHVFGPIIVEIPECQNPEHPGDVWIHENREAREYLIADITCDAIEGLLKSKA